MIFSLGESSEGRLCHEALSDSPSTVLLLNDQRVFVLIRTEAPRYEIPCRPTKERVTRIGLVRSGVGQKNGLRESGYKDRFTEKG